MALSQNTYVYMETVEETENKDKKPVENGSSYGTCIAGRKQPSRSLVHNTHSSRQHGNDKKRLINSGFYDLATAYQSVHVNY